MNYLQPYINIYHFEEIMETSKMINIDISETFVFLMYTNFIKTYTITDVSEWQECLDLPNTTYSKVFNINGYYYAFASTMVLRSSNGILWNNKISVNFGTVSGVATIFGRFNCITEKTIDGKVYNINQVYKSKTLIIGSNGVKCSYNMSDYFDVDTNLPYTEITGLCSHNNIFYASANNGKVYKSSDGIDWEVIEIGYPVNSIDSSLEKVFVGTSNGLYVSVNDNEFNKFIDEYGIIPEDFSGRILAATNSGMCYVSDNTIIYLTDMDEQTVEVGSQGNLGFIGSIIIDSSNGCYVLTSTGLWYNNNEINPYLKKVLNETLSELGIIFYYNGNIISMKKRKYYKTNAESQMDVYIPVFSASSVAKETIIKQISISNENDEDAVYYTVDEETGEIVELDGTGLICCAIYGDKIAENVSSETTPQVDYLHLIPEYYELDTNSTVYLLDKPIILNRKESIVFKSRTPKVSITIVYSYGS